MAPSTSNPSDGRRHEHLRWDDTVRQHPAGRSGCRGLPRDAFRSPLRGPRPTLPHTKQSPRRATSPGPGGSVSRNPVEVVNIIVDGRGRVIQRLPQVLLFEKRVLTKDPITVTVSGQNLQHTPNGDPHSPDTRLAAALARLDCNAIKTRHHRVGYPAVFHSTSVTFGEYFATNGLILAAFPSTVNVRLAGE